MPASREFPGGQAEYGFSGQHQSMSKLMRAVHFHVGRCHPDGPGAVEKAVYHLSRSQAARGHDVSLFSITQEELQTVEGVQVKAFPPVSGLFALPTPLTQAIEELQPAIVHLHSAFVPQNIALAGWLRSKHLRYVVSPHGELAPAVLKKKELLTMVFDGLLAGPLWTGAAFVHALNPIEAEQLRLCQIKRPIVVAPYGIDPDQVPDLATLDRAYLRHLYPQAKGKRVFMTLGRLAPVVKGLDLLLEAWFRAREALQDAVLVVVGPDCRGYRSELERHARELHLDDRVIFVGPKYGKEKFKMLAGCDVFVQPSRSEGMPFAPLEALAVEKPCLITHAVGFRDLFERHAVGLRTEASVDGIAGGLRYFAASSKNTLSQVGKEAREAVLKEFPWSRTADILWDAYRRCVRAREHAAASLPRAKSATPSVH
jgi:glycosyltransferase involved in cell wall biosynthesis